jgi:hypothetical protein
VVEKNVARIPLYGLKKTYAQQRRKTPSAPSLVRNQPLANLN